MLPTRSVVVASPELDARERAALRHLWEEAFAGDFGDDDAAHAYGGVHVLAYAGDRLVAHASAVPRRLRVGGHWHDAGYVEAVATAPSAQGRGIGAATMRHLHVEIDRRWPFAMLSTGEHAFYARLGWERWRGTSSTLRSDGTAVADGEEEGLMVRHGTLRVDVTAPVACEDRPGDAW